MTTLAKRDWLLLLLHQEPLSRFYLMNALFLIWNRSGRDLPDYYRFAPYKYGLCSFDLYPELHKLLKERLACRQASQHAANWDSYCLTPAGIDRAAAIQATTSKETLALVRAVAEEVAGLSFEALLQRVYFEAPDFASRSALS